MALTANEKKQMETNNHNSTATLLLVQTLAKDMKEVKGHFKVGDNPRKDGMVIAI